MRDQKFMPTRSAVWFHFKPTLHLADPSPLEHVFCIPSFPRELNRLIELYALPVFDHQLKDGITLRGVPSVTAVRLHLLRTHAAYRATVTPEDFCCARGISLRSYFRSATSLRFERLSAARCILALIPRPPRPERRCKRSRSKSAPPSERRTAAAGGSSRASRYAT